MTYWQPYYKQSGKKVKRLLTDDEKQAWETHPATKNLFRYEVSKQEPVKRVEVPEPIAKRFEPRQEAKKTKSKNSSKN